jgi:dTDP-4-dehydrorhamnose 3,5-epimerase
MEAIATDLPDVKLIRCKRFEDARGTFMEAFNFAAASELSLPLAWAQDNQVWSDRRYTIRGLHFQKGSAAQAKLIRVLSGAILDVAVDVRADSPTFGQHVAVELVPGPRQLFVPEGFAHGYCTLMPDTEVFYKVSRPWEPRQEGGLHWADPDLGIAWPAPPEQAWVSLRDSYLPSFARFRSDRSMAA